ncbi:hypothetical protein Hanom_Chr15g01392701 [Helianthus anomalus]
MSYVDYLKKNEEVAAQKEQSTSVQVEGDKEKQAEDVAHEESDDADDADDESTATDTELDMATLGHGKAQLKKKPTKKKKGSDEQDTTYTPSAEETKKLRIKRKAVQTGVIPRNVQARKGGAIVSKDQGGKKEKHIKTLKVPEAEKDQSVEIPKEPEVQSVEVPKVEVQKEASDDDDVKITGVRASTPPPPPENVEIPKSSRPKNTAFPDLFGDLPHASGVYKVDLILDDDFDMFNNAVFKALEKKVSELEKEKAKAEAERDVLKKQVDELTKTNKEIKKVMIKQAKKLKKMEDDVDDNAKQFELLATDITKLNVKNVKLNDINKSLNVLISELHEASSNEFKAIKLEMEAMKADKAMKDEQLNMLYTVMEHHLGIDVHPVFNNIEIQKVEERRVERERRLAKEATQRKKSVIAETQEAGGSSSQGDVEMVDVEVVQEQGFILVGESSPSLNYNDIIRRVLVEQRRRKAKEPKKLLLKWKEDEEVIEEEDEEEKIDDELFDYIDNFPEGDKDDDDQGSSRLLIINPSVQQKIEDFMNDEINEQEEDHQQESSSSGKQHVDQVFLTQPTVIYLHARYEGELELPRSRAEMLEELGLDDGKFKFDIKDEIPPSPEREREYEFKYA